MPARVDVAYGPPGSDREIREFREILHWSFLMPPEYTSRMLRRLGRKRTRLTRRGGRVSAGLCFVPMGQWFGGRSVPMLGVVAVGTDPDHRGTGVATTLMRELVKEFAGMRGTISGLYPSTEKLYRRAGYEVTGSRFTYRAAPKDIRPGDRTLAVRQLRKPDRKLIRSIYTKAARRTSGLLDRSPVMWLRYRKRKGFDPRTYVIWNGKRPEGYLVCTQKPGEFGKHFDLFLSDQAALTPEAHRRILTFFADHRTLVDRVFWSGGPEDELQMHLDEQVAQVFQVERWMTRIIDVPRALTARGYSPAVRAEVHLEVEDDLVSANRGRFVLKVADGKATVRRGGRGDVKTNVRALASHYTGYALPEDEGLRAVFAGPSPWMIETY